MRRETHGEQVGVPAASELEVFHGGLRGVDDELDAQVENLERELAEEGPHPVGAEELRGIGGRLTGGDHQQVGIGRHHRLRGRGVDHAAGCRGRRAREARRGARPGDVGHEGVDIAAGIGAEVEMIGVLVHVERQQRRAAGERMGVVG